MMHRIGKSWALAVAVIGVLCGVPAGLPGASAADTATDRATGQAAAPDESFEPFVLGSLSAYATIIERPVFSRNRRLPIAPASAPRRVMTARAVVELGRFKLAGVVILGDTKYALLKHVQDAEYTRVAEGSTLHDWRVEAINPGAVVLSQNGVKDTVELSENVQTAVEKRQARRKAATTKRGGTRSRRRGSGKSDTFVRGLGQRGNSRVTKPGARQGAPSRPQGATQRRPANQGRPARRGPGGKNN